MEEPVHHSSNESTSGPRTALAWDSLENGQTVAVILAIILVAGVALRTYGLYGRSMWFDESQSWRVAQSPFAEMIARTCRDNHPPLFYVLLRAWMALFGESLFSLRNFSLAFSAMAMLGVYLFTVEAMRLGSTCAQARDPHPLPLFQKETGPRPHPQSRSQTERGTYVTFLQTQINGRWVGLVATALFAVSLPQIRAAWEIRMYSLGTALVMFSSWLLVRALRTGPARALPWVQYMLVALLIAYTHYIAIFSLVAQCLFALVFLTVQAGWNVKSLLKGAQFRWCAVAFTGMAVGWLPWLPVFLEQRRRTAESWYRGVLSLNDVPAMCYEMFFPADVHGRQWSHEIVVTAVCGCLVLMLLWRAKAGQLLVACMAVAPLALITVASYAGTNLMIFRYFTFTQPFLLMAMAVAVARIPIDWLRGFVAYLIVAAGLILHVDFVDALDIPNRPGARAAAAYIDSRRRPGEPVIGCSPLLMFPTLFHSRSRQGWFVYTDWPVIPFFAGGSMLADDEILFEQQMQSLRTKRAWIVTTSGSWGCWGMFIPSHWTKTSEERFPEVFACPTDVTIVCYEIPDG
ncbi:MAG: hypothetical protein ABSG53_07785 [Thermoguttaceae bacterium]